MAEGIPMEHLLKGFIHVGEIRYYGDVPQGKISKYFLICRRFWQANPATFAPVDAKDTIPLKFDYSEVFYMINDEQFLARVERQYLQLELWRVSKDEKTGFQDNDMEITDENFEPVGVLHIPLHHFFIGYHDTTIANRLFKSKLPVLSNDGWKVMEEYRENLEDTTEPKKIADLNCVFAMGNEIQIEHLCETRGFNLKPLQDKGNAPMENLPFKYEKYYHILAKKPLLKCNVMPLKKKTTTSATSISSATTTSASSSSASINKAKSTEDSAISKMDKFRQTCRTLAEKLAEQQKNINSNINRNIYYQNNIGITKANECRIELIIRNAKGFPMNIVSMNKQRKKRHNYNSNSKSGNVMSVPPSTYVTFQAISVIDGNMKSYKSHEGDVFATHVCENSTQPQWRNRFLAHIELDYLNNAQKRFILKIWKKSNQSVVGATPQTTTSTSAEARAWEEAEAAANMEPAPLDDYIVGFAALDLNMFLNGRYIDGWLKVVDFNGRINGQINVLCRPTLKLSELLRCVAFRYCSLPTMRPAAKDPSTVTTDAATSSAATSAAAAAATTVESAANVAEPAGNVAEEPKVATGSLKESIDTVETMLTDIADLNLGHAVKRKFSELESISSRLRTRLADVTGGGTLTGDKPDSDDIDSRMANLFNSSDIELDEFEHDINTECPDTPDDSELKAMAANTDAKLNK